MYLAHRPWQGISSHQGGRFSLGPTTHTGSAQTEPLLLDLVVVSMGPGLAPQLLLVLSKNHSYPAAASPGVSMCSLSRATCPLILAQEQRYHNHQCNPDQADQASNTQCVHSDSRLLTPCSGTKNSFSSLFLAVIIVFFLLYYGQ
jgi:hypothetical protein